MIFPKILIQWYLANKRELPFRETKDPYFVWLSEIMLQQTRVAQGLPYYLAFTEAFPTVSDLGNATENDVLKLWQGLGYYSRARNLHFTAKYVSEELNGSFPNSYAELLKLKGIGQYTAAAIASFCFDEPVPVVDGNVFRVIARYFGVDTDISSSGAKAEFTAIAAAQMPAHNAAVFNQAIMEFGALQCTPKSPHCESCPLNQTCFAFRNHKVGMLPVKNKKTKVRERFFNYLVFSDELDQTILRQRKGKGIWENLYEFPLVETDTEADAETIANLISSENAIVSIEEINRKPIVHKLSHQHLKIKFRKIKVEGIVQNGIKAEQLRDYPMPAVLFNFVAEHWK
ncbi:MAG: A/G-specific adenine glycosylase [Flavobacterium sp.]|nr:MAG: A/G-specific adenine glycosylase [Flavobacterium sp.]